MTTETTAMTAQGADLANDNNFSNALERLAMFTEKPDNELKEISSTYLTLEENKTYDFICTGLTTLDLQDKEVEAATLIDINGESFTCGAAVLVSSIKRIIAKFPEAFLEGRPVRIIVKDKIKSPKGSYLDMVIKTI